MLNYIDLFELISAFYILFLLTLLGAFYYFLRKYREKETYLREEVFVNVKVLDKEIKEIKILIQDLPLRIHETEEYLIKNQDNNEEIFNSFKISFSKINASNIESNKLLNILNRKINKFIKE